MSKFWKGFCPSWKNRQKQNDHDKMSEIEEPDIATVKFFEIPREDIEIDTNRILTRDIWSTIFEGRIRSLDTNCAIKTCKQTNEENFESLQEILNELKIMSHIGNHINIAKLIGACTQEIREGRVYMALEYCEYGRMDNYIKSNKYMFRNEVIPRRSSPCTCTYMPCVHDQSYSESTYANLPLRPPFSTSLLGRWAQEIAAGMSFIGSEKVIHNDLALRNIVLDKNLTAKITDFAYAQRLPENCGTDSIQNEVLPWKWVAPETFRTRTISLKSDLWSYGITLWEIFSLGEEPYGEKSFSMEFFEELTSTGCSLNQPMYASQEMYEIMKKCWTIEPESRPSFDDIQDSLRRLTSQAGYGQVQ